MQDKKNCAFLAKYLACQTAVLEIKDFDEINGYYNFRGGQL